MTKKSSKRLESVKNRVEAPPRSPDDIQKEYNELALQVGDKAFRHAVLGEEIPTLQKKMYQLTLEMQKAKAQNG